MGKVNPNYSQYQIKKAINDTVEQIAPNTFRINGKNTVIDNKKNFRCDCKWANDNKLHIKYCHCILATMRFIDPDLFWTEVSKK